MTISRLEQQYQMSNEFAHFIIKYIKENNITFSKFCEDAKLPRYITGKIINRKIKMHAFPDLIQRIADYFGITCMEIMQEQPTKTDKKTQ